MISMVAGPVNFKPQKVAVEYTKCHVAFWRRVMSGYNIAYAELPLVLEAQVPG